MYFTTYTKQVYRYLFEQKDKVPPNYRDEFDLLKLEYVSRLERKLAIVIQAGMADKLPRTEIKDSMADICKLVASEYKAEKEWFEHLRIAKEI